MILLAVDVVQKLFQGDEFRTIGTRFTPLATFSTMSSVSIFYCNELCKSYSCSNLRVVQIFEVPKNFRKKCAHEKSFFFGHLVGCPKKNLRKHSIPSVLVEQNREPWVEIKVEFPTF